MRKSLERIYVEWFVKQIGWKESRIHDSEQPDFIIDFQNKKIGLEITNIYKDEGRKGSPQKETESLNNKWLQNVDLEYYIINNNRPIEIKVLKSGDQPLPDPRNLAKEISKKVSTSDLEVSEVEISISRGTKIKLSIMKLPNEFGHYKRWTFINNHVGWTGKIDKERIYNIIKTKKIKSNNYNKNVDELFLLIIIDSSTNSGMLNLPTENIDFSCTEFDSIYLVKHLIQIQKIG